MRKILLIICIFIATALVVTYIPMLMSAEQDTQSYEKWGRLAVEHTKEKYPNATFIDYLYVGKETEQKETIETFKLWLREGSREFGVYVYIKFETATEEIIEIETREASR